MAVIGSLNVLLQASTAGLTAGLAKAKDKTADFVKSWKPSWQGVGLAVAAAAAAAGAAFVVLAKQAADNAGRLDDLAQNIGTTVDHLHALEYAAHMSGVSAGDLEGILSKLNILLAEAAVNGGPTAKALEQIGLNAHELTKLDITDAFKRIAKGLAGVEHEGQRASLAMDILGKAGTKAIQLVGNDIEGLEARAKRLGIVMSQVDADKLNAAQDAIDDIGFVIQAAGAKLAADLAPALVTVVQLFTEGETTGADLMAMMNGLADVGVVLGAVLLGAMDAVNDSFLLARSGLYQFVKLGTDGLASVAKAANIVSKALGQGNLIDPEAITTIKLFGEQSAEDAKRLAAIANKGNAGIEFWNKYSNATNTFSESLKKNRQALGERNEELANGEQEAEKWIAALQEQLQTVGMSTDEAKLWKLQQQEINSVLTEQAQALLDQIKAKEDAIEAEKELAKAKEDAAKKAADAAEKEREEIIKRNEEYYKSRQDAADAVRESIKTDKERRKEKEAELRMMLNHKDIDQTTFDKAMKNLNKSDPREVRFAELATKGSAEARASIMRNQNTTPQNKIADNTGKLVKQTEQVIAGIMQVAAGVGNQVQAAW